MSMGSGERRSTTDTERSALRGGTLRPDARGINARLRGFWNGAKPTRLSPTTGERGRAEPEVAELPRGEIGLRGSPPPSEGRRRSYALGSHAEAEDRPSGPTREKKKEKKRKNSERERMSGRTQSCLHTRGRSAARMCTAERGHARPCMLTRERMSEPATQIRR